MTEIPYPDRSFDVTISIAVIYHGTLAEMRRAIAEIHRVLRPGGLANLALELKRSFRYGKGEEIEPDTHIHDTGEDAGVSHYYRDHKETEELLRLRAFAIREINHMERIFAAARTSYWEVWVEKP